MKVTRPYDRKEMEHLEWALKLAYAYSIDEDNVTLEELNNAMCDALCNLIGDKAFCALYTDEF